MRLLTEIPDSFWSLFRSVNRNTYIEALLKINEEYEYHSYFLSKEVCLQILGDYFAQRRIQVQIEELESEQDILEPPAARVLNWLVRTQWLKKLEDYHNLVTNIVIPDYAAVFIGAFEKLGEEDMDETQVYIQNIYAILFSFKNDVRSNNGLLRTALVNTRKLNKALQDMLHNMDKFFLRLLEKNFYGELLKEHLEGYVEEIVRKKYHILKTSDNFYQYKANIKLWIRELREEKESEEMQKMLDEIERGFDEIERRIANMDKEHSKYIRATVSRLNYLLSGEDTMKGLVVQLLNRLSASKNPEAGISAVGNLMNLSSVEVLSELSLYKKRRPRVLFAESIQDGVEEEELSREDVLKMNRIRHRYSQGQIEEFITKNAVEGRARITDDMIQTEEDFDQLILAYDYAVRKNTMYMIESQEVEEADNGRFCYPRLTFIRRHQ